MSAHLIVSGKRHALSGIAAQLHAEHLARRARSGGRPSVALLCPPMTYPPAASADPRPWRPVPLPIVKPPVAPAPPPPPAPDPFVVASERLAAYRAACFYRPKRGVHVSEIKIAISSVYRVTIGELESETRYDRVCRPRQIAMMLCRRLSSASLPEIGRAFGNRDHTTVLHAVFKFEALSRVDPDLAETIAAITRLLTFSQTAFAEAAE